MSKFFLPDKETVDKIKSNIGTTTDDGSATGGTLMGKVNAVIKNFFDLRSWITTYMDAAISSRESEANAASRYDGLSSWLNGLRTGEIAEIANAVRYGNANANGNLSQKLSYIINNGPKNLVSKQTSFQVSSSGTHVILDISGAGRFEYAQTNLPYNADSLYIECDGVATQFTGKSGTCIIGRFMSYPRDRLTCVTSDAFNNVNYLVWQPLYFKNNLRIFVVKSSAGEGTFHAHYSLYE